MKRDPAETKLKIAEAAIYLFTSQGFKGTTVRQIAKKAGVNLALISYHFGGKKGLLEELITSFFEGYIRRIEIVYHTSSASSVKGSFIELVETLLIYQQKNLPLARFVYREMTLDSTLVRELMSTYLLKEKYFLQTMFEKGMKKKEFRRQPVDLLTIQFKDMMMLPFLHPLYLAEVYQISAETETFIKPYKKWMISWFDKCVCQNERKKPLFSAVQAPLFGTIQEKWGS
ncbi:forespore capture DNA-binding protein RefZ [Fictibacillus phosphorivorans]|uniref:forespore capture DNA-binding protein RefZ n=1 Tax=Fictibacillus phosphorivorans TaxID=1221500 RepID=UPI00203F7477|nr:forespore capture DNA-binding protein RefZ [Fictibacillus phosphorivorans]MCM3717954.1 forespore capture DNA-binding protein RefZ [Fictibacillus phosphorivorans]MCM3775403.1 forespore capture DNA-binding protein RefZ [Fictibacillus phosphorivorans]